MISWKSARLYSENEVKRVFGFLGQHLSFLSKWERLENGREMEKRENYGFETVRVAEDRE
jgi:hypothetical protein